MLQERTARGGPRLSRGLAVAAVLCFGLSLPTNAALAAPPGTATVTGIVLDAVTGEPIVGATVSDPTSSSPAVKSAADGVYTFTTTPGQHQLQAVAAGRPTGYYEDFTQTPPSRTFTLADGQDLDTGDIYLAPPAGVYTGQISGSVHAGDGVVAGVKVKVYLAGTTTVAGNATTDENGNYSVGSLKDGDYQVFFDASGTSFGSVWYTDAENQASATRLLITGGGSQGSIDASLIGGFTATPTPTVTGTPAVGQTLTGVVGNWAPAPTLEYRWLRNGAAIDGATGTTYAVQAADQGKTLTFEVTAKKTGFLTAVRSSAPVTIGAAALVAPVPTMTGTFAVGQTVTAVPGTWTPAPVTLTYQWSAGGTAIAGATGATYVLTPAELGKTITVTVTGTKTDYPTTAKTSAASAAVVAAALVAPVPTISGTPSIGNTLTATPGTWGPAPVALTYQWLRAGTAINGATASTYLVTAADATQQLSVKVTGTKAGFATTSTTSATITVPAAVPTGDKMTAGQQLTGTQSLTSAGGQFSVSVVGGLHEEEFNKRNIWPATTPTGRLVMQSDGNLVMYSEAGVAMWSSSTFNNPGAYAVLQSDGNFVVYSAAGKALWANYPVMDQLVSTQTPAKSAVLRVGDSMKSADGRTKLVLQGDGNLVLYGPGGALWWTGTNKGAKLALQADGNLVLYSAADAPIWATMTGSANAGQRRLVVQSDGNLVEYGPAGAVWFTGTRA